MGRSPRQPVPPVQPGGEINCPSLAQLRRACVERSLPDDGDRRAFIASLTCGEDSWTRDRFIDLTRDSTTDQSMGELPFENGRYLCLSHKPKTRKDNEDTLDDPYYWLLRAYSQGCLNCVKICIERHRLDTRAKSDSGKYDALSFAENAKQDDVAAYLQGVTPEGSS